MCPFHPPYPCTGPAHQTTSVPYPNSDWGWGEWFTYLGRYHSWIPEVTMRWWSPLKSCTNLEPIVASWTAPHRPDDKTELISYRLISAIEVRIYMTIEKSLKRFFFFYLCLRCTRTKLWNSSVSDAFLNYFIIFDKYFHTQHAFILPHNIRVLSQVLRFHHNNQKTVIVCASNRFATG